MISNNIYSLIINPAIKYKIIYVFQTKFYQYVFHAGRCGFMPFSRALSKAE